MNFQLQQKKLCREKENSEKTIPKNDWRTRYKEMKRQQLRGAA